MLKGKPSSFSVIDKDPSVNGNPSFASDASSVDLGKSYAISQTGAYNEFVIEKLTKVSSEPKLLGLSMSWVFENETAGSAVNLDGSSYFYIEKVQTI